jgi:hypothetical protein
MTALVLPLLVLVADLTPRPPSDREVVRLSPGDPASGPISKGR